MSEKILNLVQDFLKKNNIEGLDLEKILDSLPLDEIRSMVSGNDLYVVKRSGKLEKYDEEKLERSISNAAERGGMPLNQSDLNIIIGDIRKRLKDDGARINKTSFIKEIVRSVLLDERYSKILKSYDSYVKDQR